MRVAVYEHLTATGNVYSHGWVEGEAMLKASVEDLKRAGHEVHVVTSLPPKRPVDVVIVIAPSTGRLIYSLAKVCEDEGLTVIDSPSSAIFLASDKALLYRNLELHGIKAPRTTISSFDEALDDLIEALSELDKVVVKPADGDGCMGISVVSSVEEASMAIRKAKQSTRLPYLVIQEFIDGLNLSVNVLAQGDYLIPLSVNLQRVLLRGPSDYSTYIGGVVPYFEHAKAAIESALKTIRSLGPVKGFFGVDLVVRGGEPYAIEVNPRLTASYLALREVSKVNIADMAVRAALGVEGLEPPVIEGVAIVEKAIAERDLVVKDDLLKPPQGAKLLSSIAGRRSVAKRGDAYALYVMRVEERELHALAIT